MTKQPINQSSNGIRDISIGFAEGASNLLIFTTAMAATGMAYTNLMTVGLLVSCLFSVITGLVTYFTLKKLRDEHEQNVLLIQNESALQSAIEEKKQFLSALGMYDDIVQASEEDIFETIEAERLLNEAPPTLQEARNAAMRMSLSTFAGTMFPLLPYYFLSEKTSTVVIAALITLPFIAIALYIKSRLTGVAPWFGSLGNTLVTACATISIWLIIRWVSGTSFF